MKIIKEFLCCDTPTDEEIKKSIEIVNKEDCIVKLCWFIPYQGWYKFYIKNWMTLESCRSRIPKIYSDASINTM